MRGWSRVVGAVALAGCSRAETEAPNAETNAAAPSAPAAANAVIGNPSTPSGNVSRFTAEGLNKCRLVEKNEEEGPYYRHRCPGIGGYQYEVVESDLRQSLVIIGTGGRRDDVSLAGVAGGGGFSILGPTFDWRGPVGKPPRTMTVRFSVNESTEPNVPATSYLVVIRLAAPACPVAAVPPGPGQSDKARAIADREKLPPCVEG